MSMQQPAPQKTQADIDWAKHQRRLTDVSTALTAAGATGLGVMLAGKTRAAKRFLPKPTYKKLQSGKADDLRNTIALASMVGGVASGAHWSKKLKRDATPEQQAANLATASKADIEKALGLKPRSPLFPSSIVNRANGQAFMRRGGYRRTPLPRPRRVV
jgi:hypothetical protein